MVLGEGPRGASGERACRRTRLPWSRRSRHPANQPLTAARRCLPVANVVVATTTTNYGAGWWGQGNAVLAVTTMTNDGLGAGGGGAVHAWVSRNDPPMQVPRRRSSGSFGGPSRSGMAWRLPSTSTWLVTRQRSGTVIATRAATLHTVRVISSWLGTEIRRSRSNPPKTAVTVPAS